MPKAVVTANSTKRFDLKSLPPADGEEGGFVVVRRMSYGQKLARQDLATATSMKAAKQNGGKISEEDLEMSFEVMNRAVAEYEFSHCIVEHNLTDESGNLLNFMGQVSQMIDRLDPRVGDEISEYIDEMNNFEVSKEAEKSRDRAPQTPVDQGSRELSSQ